MRVNRGKSERRNAVFNWLTRAQVSLLASMRINNRYATLSGVWSARVWNACKWVPRTALGKEEW